MANSRKYNPKKQAEYELNRNFDKPVTVRVTAEQKLKLQAVCRANHCTYSDYFRYCIDNPFS